MLLYANKSYMGRIYQRTIDVNGLVYYKQKSHFNFYWHIFILWSFSNETAPERRAFFSPNRGKNLSFHFA